MRFAARIPTTIAVGQQVRTPVTVLFSSAEDVLPLQDDIWLFASLIYATTGAAAEDGILQGQRAESLRPLTAEVANSEHDIARCSFHDLVLTRPGLYRLKVTAVDMGSDSMKGKILPAIESDVIKVVANTNSAGSTDSQDWEANN